MEEGEVVCTKLMPVVKEGEEQTEEKEQVEVSDKLGPSSFFGELALLNNDVRKATVTATQPTRCAVIDRFML